MTALPHSTQKEVVAAQTGRGAPEHVEGVPDHGYC